MRLFSGTSITKYHQIESSFFLNKLDLHASKGSVSVSVEETAETRDDDLPGIK